ncbi:MAG: hypothetical protein WD512_16420 [Candidatus Paceibacterota bacterium]
MINLKTLVEEITKQESLQKQSSVAQIAEIIAIMGIRWRSMSKVAALEEFEAIVERAGLQSEHNK